jgi:ParB family chromosome partitioning protein
MEELHQSEVQGQQGVVRRRLGRGLNALLGGHRDDQDAAPETNYASAPPAAPVFIDPGLDGSQISMEFIERNPYQPRKDFAEDAMAELVESIRQHGVLQPLLVRIFDGRYQLIAGERRLMAARRAGLETVPCRVMELDDQHVFEVAIEENLKRKDLNVLEKAQAFQEYLTQFGSNVEALAQRLSMNRSTLANYLRLLELSDPVKESLSADLITNGHARALLSLTPDDQAALCRRIEEQSLSVRQTEQEVRNILKGEATATIPFPASQEKATAPAASNHVLSLQDQLRQQLGAKVEIKLSGKDSGKIIIRFDSNEEFEHVVRQLGRAA